MALGLQSVDIIGRAESSGKKQMQLNYRFRVGEKWMDDDEAQILAQSGKGAHFFKRYRYCCNR